MLLTVGAAPALALASPSPSAAGAAPLAPATPHQWAFGGNASGSCSNTTCSGSFTTNNSTFSMSWKYYLMWVVIYTATNVSPSQTELQVQAALNFSLSLDLSSCTVVTVGQPCETTSVSGSASGWETAGGWTNVTNGSVDLLAGPGAPTTVGARAVINGSSTEAFNVSGNVQFSAPSYGGSGTVSFAAGGYERSAIAFAAPLGLVPQTLSAGEQWTATQPYTATGSYASSSSYTVTLTGSIPITQSNATHGSVAPSGTLTVNGTDLGTSPLWDNYTNPHEQSSAQLIVLEFSGGNFSGDDGWVLVPTDLYDGVLGSFGGLVPNATSVPAAPDDGYYAPGTGFVGASLAGNTSNLSGIGDAPNITLKAGPEPVSVAQAQYDAITAGPAASHSFPLLLLVLVVGIAAIAAAVGLLFWRRRARARGLSPDPAPASTPEGLPPQPPEPPRAGP